MMGLGDLRAFARVADLKSITGAARALNLPKSSVSRSLVRLEEAAGAALFERSTHHVHLTDAGRLLLPYAVRIMREVDEAEAALGSYVGVPRGTLRVSAPLGFAYSLLAPMVPPFLVENPEVQVIIDVENHTLDMLVQEIDLVIRFAPLPDSGLIGRRLVELDLWLCASPAYLNRRGTPTTIAELEGHDFIGRIDWPTQWTFKSPGGDVEQISINPRAIASEPSVDVALTMNGAGIGWLPKFIAVPLIERGELVRILPDAVTDSAEIYVLYPSHRSMSAKVRAFIDALSVYLANMNM